MKWLSVPIQLRFHEIDSYKIVNNMFFLSWFELGRFAVAEKAGIVSPRFDEEEYAFVVNHININYKKSVYFGQKVSCESIICKTTGSKLVFEHKIKNQINSTIHAQGNSEVILLKSNKMQFSMPSWIDESIGDYVNIYQGGLPR